MNQQIKNKKPEAITRAVGLYFTGRPLLEIRKSTGIGYETIGCYVRLMRSVRQEVRAPRAELCNDASYAITDGQTRTRLAEALP